MPRELTYMNGIYYHFLSYDHAVDDLEKKRIKVALINELNDPFELRPNLRKEFIERKSYNLVRGNIAKKYGLLCFADDWREPLLWGHYADKHRGVAIGFRILRNEEFEVSYTQPKEMRPMLELTGDLAVNERLFLDLARKKYKNWSYESEYRVVVDLADCVHGTGRDKGKYFIDFADRLSVEEIVLGDGVPRADHGMIKKIAERAGATRFIAARLCWEDYKVQEDGGKTKRLQTF